MTRDEVRTYLIVKYGSMEEVFYRWTGIHERSLTKEDEELATEYYRYYFNEKLDKWD